MEKANFTGIVAIGKWGHPADKRWAKQGGKPKGGGKPEAEAANVDAAKSSSDSEKPVAGLFADPRAKTWMMGLFGSDVCVPWMPTTAMA